MASFLFFYSIKLYIKIVGLKTHILYKRKASILIVTFLLIKKYTGSKWIEGTN